jgi:peptidoglycan/LPS O-acetylase OafA/YrhL
LRPLDAFLHDFGWSGVDLFFVLRGFLIGGLLFSEIQKFGELDLGRFFARRALRIWPPYFALILYLFVTISMDPAVGLPGAWSQLWPAVIHIQNFILAPRDHLWSLAVEEHFYFMLPLFLWVVTRNKPTAKTRIPAVPIACVAISVASIALRTVLVLTGHAQGRTPTYMCTDPLFFGVNLAYFKAYQPSVLAAVVRRKWTLLLGFALLVPGLFKSEVFLDIVGYTSVYLGYSLVLVHFVSVKPREAGLLGRIMLSPPARLIALIGVNSYSIYLWHRDSGWWLYERALLALDQLQVTGTVRWLVYTTAFVTGGVIGGMVMERIIEKPMQTLRTRLFPPRVKVTLLEEPVQPEPAPRLEVAV